VRRASTTSSSWTRSPLAHRFELVSVEEILEIAALRPEGVELVLTGRYAPPEVIAVADLVTEMKVVKHYYDQGVGARDGIER